VVARVVGGNGKEKERRFTATFTVGRAADCGLRIRDPAVDPHHAQVLFDGIVWWVRHIGNAGGTLVDGAPVQLVPLTGEVKVQLGKGGPVVSLALTEREALEPEGPEPTTRASGAAPVLTEAEIVKRYLQPVGDAPAGKQTMMFRAAFESVQKKSSRRYHLVIGAILLALVCAGGVIAYQRQKLHTLRATAERVFYAMKTFELRAVQLEELVVLNADPAQVAALGDSRERLKHMESEYDAFVQELGVYAKVPERQRYILRVARRFGECEVNIPKEFIAEVERYIERWKQNDRFANALRRAKQRGYGPVITQAFTDGNLPPQYVYLALQESNFDDRAVGPATRYGFAKGMWQFISLTGHKYGLQIGPLYDQAVYDPRDDRFDMRKATRAAVKYIRELTTTEAQASGLLAMASYNWGENNVRGIIASMPENPQERNFWRLLAHKEVPAETYDYVLSIFSAAVICENPHFFGFDVECPVAPRPGIDELGRDRVR
jgi:hypothetical protein